MILDFWTPGQLIAHLLKERGWTQRTLAIVLGVDEATVSNIIAAKASVDAEMALALGDVFNIEPERFLELQKSHDLAKARLAIKPDPGRATRALLFGDLPIAEMIKRGWIRAR